MQEPSLVILIDDDDISNFINEAILKSHLSGTEIKSYIDPIQALKFIKDDYRKDPIPTIIFLDINMPQMSGWEVLAELAKLKDISNFIKVVMISSSIDASDKKKSLENPLILDFVSKPLSNDLIKRLIN